MPKDELLPRMAIPAPLMRTDLWLGAARNVCFSKESAYSVPAWLISVGTYQQAEPDRFEKLPNIIGMGQFTYSGRLVRSSTEDECTMRR